MKSNQKIACSVCSCKHNCEGKECDLKEIEVCPKEGINVFKLWEYRWIKFLDIS